MAKNKHLKRKPTPFIKVKQKAIDTVETDEEESASEQEVNIDLFKVTIHSGFDFNFQMERVFD